MKTRKSPKPVAKKVKVEKPHLDVNKIIDAGREFYKLKGDSFSMRNIANKFSTGPSSLYRHVANKRELWFAILTKDFEEFQLEMVALASDHKGSYKELLFKLGRFFMEFSRRDFGRFKLMYLSEPPSSTKPPGRFENNCNPQSFKFLVELTKNVIKESGLNEVNPIHLANTFWAMVLGASVITSPINDYQSDTIFEEKNQTNDYYEMIIESVNKILSK